ncbi:DUF4189 domain-containing protein [Dankookia rubra]
MRSRQSVQAEARRAAPPVGPRSGGQSGAQSGAPRPGHSPPPGAPLASAPAASRGLPHAAPPPTAVPPLAVAPLAAAAPAARATQLAVAAAGGSAAAAGGRGWGAAYLATAPGTDFGLSVGLADRLAAHAQAQLACGARGAPCRAALEFADRCGAVTQARRTLGLFRTADPRTYSVSYAAAGSGPTRDAAEGAALDECRSRERTTSCEVVASSCGRP